MDSIQKKDIYFCRRAAKRLGQLDSWIVYYNTERPHSGKFYYGKTPMQTFIDSIDLAKEKLIDRHKLIFGNDLDSSSGTTSFKKVVEDEIPSNTNKQKFNNFEQSLIDNN